jgi:hypothetical protein
MADPRTSSGDDWAEENLHEQPAWVSTDYVEEGNEVDQQRTLSRRRSMECSAIELQIIDTEVNQDHTVYVIKVSCGVRDWLVKRRYKDFDYLDRKLRKFLPAVTMPSLPPKSYWRSSNNPSIVEQRKMQLQDYLHSLLGMNQIWARNDLVLFLNDESNIMTFIWSVERMRRLKEMLRLTNQDEAEKITSEFEEARKQVEQLQAKLSQMEMIFLQQATGVASQQLSSAVLRSLSRADNPLSLQLALELTQEHAALYSGENDNYGTSNDDLQVDIAGPDATGASFNHDIQSDDDEDKNNRKATSPRPPLTPMEPEALIKALSLAQGTESVADYVKKKTSKHQHMTADEARTLTVSYEIQEALRISEELLPSTTSPQTSLALHFSSTASDSETSSRTGQLSISGVGVSSSVDAVMKGLLHQEATSALTTLLDYGASVETNEGQVTYPQSASAGTVKWVSEVFAATDALLEGLQPTALSLDTRLKIFKYVRDLIARTVGCQAFPAGSSVSHTFLPDGDMDVTAFVPTKMIDDAWYVKINEALCFSAVASAQNPSENQSISVRNVSFVNNGEIKEIRSVINNIRVDISTNQLSSLMMETLIERVDEFLGKNHVFKRSLLLVKAWLTYDSLVTSDAVAASASNNTNNTGVQSSPDNTSSNSSISLLDKLSTSALVVILIYVFQNEGEHIVSPFQALVHFFLTMLNFDWGKYAMTIHGMVRLSDIDQHTSSYHYQSPTFHQTHHYHHRHHQSSQHSSTSATSGTVREPGYLPDSLFDFTIGDEIRSERIPTLSKAPSGSNNTVTSTVAAETAPRSNEEVSGIAIIATEERLEPENSCDDKGKGTDGTEVPVTNATITEGETPTPAGNPPASNKPKHHHAHHNHHHREYKCDIFNVLDPFQAQHNLFASLEVQDIEIVVSAVVQGYKQLQKIVDACSASSGDSNTCGLTRVQNLMEKFWSHSVSKCQKLTQESEPELSSCDVLQAATQDLQFSRFYGSIALGGKIELATLTQMILIILDKRGPMPVGEIGKNLQAILGCENLSRRLKEQFTGLKRAIENANTPRLRVGNEHQFNPVVALVGEGSVLPEFVPCQLRWACQHAAYMFTPYQIHLAMQAQVAREAQLQAQRAAQSSKHLSASSPGSAAVMRHSGSPSVLTSSSVSSSTRVSEYEASNGGTSLSISPVTNQYMHGGGSASSLRSRGNSGSNFNRNSNSNYNTNNNNYNGTNSNNNSASNSVSGSYSPNNRHGGLHYPMRSPNRRNNSNNNNSNSANGNNAGYYNYHAMPGYPMSIPPPTMMPLQMPISYDPVTGTPLVPPPPIMMSSSFGHGNSPMHHSPVPIPLPTSAVNTGANNNGGSATSGNTATPTTSAGASGAASAGPVSASSSSLSLSPTANGSNSQNIPIPAYPANHLMHPYQVHPSQSPSHQQQQLPPSSPSGYYPSYPAGGATNAAPTNPSSALSPAMLSPHAAFYHHTGYPQPPMSSANAGAPYMHMMPPPQLQQPPHPSMLSTSPYGMSPVMSPHMHHLPAPHHHLPYMPLQGGMGSGVPPNAPGGSAMYSYHHSLSTSLSSSYGANPSMPMGYVPVPVPVTHMQQPQPQHVGAGNPGQASSSPPPGTTTSSSPPPGVHSNK